MTVAKGTVHDLGYKRYVGTRRPQSTRWQVIARNVIRQSWKGFWRLKLPLLSVVINTAVWGILMSTDKVMEVGRKIVASPEDLILYMSYSGFGFYCRSLFVASLLLPAGAIANDAASGAFSFYFARPVRTVDYVLGKLAGYWLLFAGLLIGGPLILAGVRLGMYGDAYDALAHADLLAKVILIGALGALAFAAVPLAISALVPNRRYALALWATYYLVFGLIVQVIGAKQSPVIGVLNIPTAIDTMAAHLFHVQVVGAQTATLAAAIVGLVVHSAAAIAILYVRVAQQRAGGIGGVG